MELLINRGNLTGAGEKANVPQLLPPFADAPPEEAITALCLVQDK
jgi:hypothetical protein